MTTFLRWKGETRFDPPPPPLLPPLPSHQLPHLSTISLGKALDLTPPRIFPRVGTLSMPADAKAPHRYSPEPSPLHTGSGIPWSREMAIPRPRHVSLPDGPALWEGAPLCNRQRVAAGTQGSGMGGIVRAPSARTNATGCPSQPRPGSFFQDCPTTPKEEASIIPADQPNCKSPCLGLPAGGEHATVPSLAPPLQGSCTGSLTD